MLRFSSWQRGLNLGTALGDVVRVSGEFMAAAAGGLADEVDDLRGAPVVFLVEALAGAASLFFTLRFLGASLAAMDSKPGWVGGGEVAVGIGSKSISAPTAGAAVDFLVGFSLSFLPAADFLVTIFFY